MCGIFACLTPGNPPTLSRIQEARLRGRGPDHLGHERVVLNTLAGQINISAHASVLSLRGTELTTQPIRLPSSSASLASPGLLCWNGEVWRFKGEYLESGTADTSFVAQELAEAIELDHETSASPETSSVLRTLHAIEGPFAFLLVDQRNQRVYFGRDRLGRRSLLTKRIDDALFIASVGDDQRGWQEVGAEAIECIEFSALKVLQSANESANLSSSTVMCTGNGTGNDQHQTTTIPVPIPIQIQYSVLSFNDKIPSPDAQALTISSPEVETLHSLLHKSLLPRINTLPPPIPTGTPDAKTSAVPEARIAVLFSGGLDCTTLTLLIHNILMSTSPEEPIDLLNVAFENPRIVRAHNGGELDQQKKTKTKTKTKTKMKGKTPVTPRSDNLDDHDADILNSQSTDPDPQPQPHPHPQPEPQSAHQYDPYSTCPDRITALKSHAELQNLCPTRHFNLVQINIPYTEFQSHRAEITSLMGPHDTEMDMSIAAALYFASRGQGTLYSSPSPSPSPSHSQEPNTDTSTSTKSKENPNPNQQSQKPNTPNQKTYTTPSKILISGLGADELLAGYTRHFTAHKLNGFPGLLSELEIDYRRLGQRNLGRDDRVLSHWGREVRFPFLDERVVRWCIEQNLELKCGFGMQGGAQDVEEGKRILRLLALKLGMEGVSREKKRAIQFGARTAKMESGKSKGTDSLTLMTS